MQAKIETLKAKDAQSNEYLLYPRTLTDCITDSNGTGFVDVVRAIPVANAITADRATYDAAGNNIAESFTKLQDGTVNAGDSAKLGGETATQWQTKIDNIQTTSARTMQANGWYRIAYRDGNTQIYDNSCFIALRKFSSSGESHLLRLEATNLGAKFNIISSRVDDAVQFHTMKKIRYTYDSAKSYIEVHCSSAISTYGFMATVFDTLNAQLTSWKPLNFEETSETVDGVTVSTTYDIPANASPVTDLDIAKAKNNFQPQYYNVATSAINDKIKEIYTNSAPASFFNAIVGNNQNVMYKVEGYKLNDLYGYVRRCSYMGGTNTGRTSQCQILNGVWSEWENFSTTADLANYLPLSGGEVNGYIRIKSSGTNERHMSIANSLRGISIGVKENGGAYVYDDTNAKSIASLQSDGNYIWYGTATGNLPLSGGGTVVGTNNMPVRLRSGNGNNAYQGYETKAGTFIGALGFNVNGKPSFLNSAQSVESELLHTGNSAKVAIQESAPTDTTALWYDTVNKMCKRYVDGAWQA